MLGTQLEKNQNKAVADLGCSKFCTPWASEAKPCDDLASMCGQTHKQTWVWYIGVGMFFSWLVGICRIWWHGTGVKVV